MAETYATFEENLSLDEAINVLQSDIPDVGSTLSERLQAGETLEGADQAVYDAISSPTAVALMRELKEAGVEDLATEGAPSGTPMERVSSILSSGHESFAEQGLEPPDLDVYYEAEAIAAETGQDTLDVVGDIETARSLQITGEELAANPEAGIDTMPSIDTFSADPEAAIMMAEVEPANYVDIEVISIGRQLGDLPLYGEYGHAALVLRNNDTGEVRVSSAFPVDEYPGGIVDVIRDRAFDESLLTPFGPEDSANAERGGDFEVIERSVIRGDWDEVNDKLDQFNEFIDAQDIPYRPRSLNSNTYEGDARELITGEEPTNDTDRSYPGRGNDMMDYEGTDYELLID